MTLPNIHQEPTRIDGQTRAVHLPVGRFAN